METNNQISVFKFQNNNEIRVFLIQNEPWFVAKDVCDILELSDVSMSLQKIEDDEKMIQKVFVSSKRRDVWLINESGLYALILRSSKPQAKTFRKWVTSEVLPQIRKTGMYIQGDNKFNQLMQEMINELKRDFDERYVSNEDYEKNLDAIVLFSQRIDQAVNRLDKKDSSLNQQLQNLENKMKEYEAEKSGNKVYLLYNPSKREYKIGQSANVRKRKKNFLSVEPDIEMILCINCANSREAYATERFLHLRFEHKRVHGEWFKLDKEDVEFIKSLGFFR